MSQNLKKFSINNLKIMPFFLNKKLKKGEFISYNMEYAQCNKCRKADAERKRKQRQ